MRSGIHSFFSLVNMTHPESQDGSCFWLQRLIASLAIKSNRTRDCESRLIPLQSVLKLGDLQNTIGRLRKGSSLIFNKTLEIDKIPIYVD